MLCRVEACPTLSRIVPTIQRYVSHSQYSSTSIVLVLVVLVLVVLVVLVLLVIVYPLPGWREIQPEFGVVSPG